MGPAIRRLLPYALRYRRDFLLGLVCALAATGVSLLAPWILQQAVDDLNAGVTRVGLAAYALAMLGIAVLGGVFRFLMRRTVIGASRRIEYDLRNDFFAHLQRLPPAYFHARRTGDLMSRATNDLSAVRMMIGPAVMYAVSTGVLFVVAVAMMLSLDVMLTLVALAALPCVSYSVSYFGREIHERFERIQAQLSELSAVTQEALAGVRVVRAYRQEDVELLRFRQANEEYVERNGALIRLQGLFYPSMTFFLGVAAMLVLWLGSREVILGRLSIGEFVAFNSYLAMLSWPMIAFGWVTNLLQRGLASWQRMLAVLDEPPAITDGDAREAFRTPADVHGAVEFRDLTFAYDGRPVLEHVSVCIEPGQMVAIVGPTGSGKSTLLNLIPRLYDPPAGTVFVDGVDVREIPLRVLRGAVAMVPQEPFLFSLSLAANIAFGSPVDGSEDRHREAMSRAAATARIDKDVADFPQGYETMVGERGITLSGGQKQRTAIARALMVDPRILLLDDALSSVDTYTEEEILTRLRTLMRARTSIVVSHRVSTVREADLILVLDGGRVIERGRHDDLVARGGFYAELHRKQQLEEELAAS
jgi:ATP-binding cassette subfamily B protein